MRRVGRVGRVGRGPRRRRVGARGGGQRQRRQVQHVLGALARQLLRQRRAARGPAPARAAQGPLGQRLHPAVLAQLPRLRVLVVPAARTTSITLNGLLRRRLHDATRRQTPVVVPRRISTGP